MSYLDFEDKIFEDFLTFGLGRPKNLRYNIGHTKDVSPVYWQKFVDNKTKEELGIKSTCRTVGISPSDVKVELTKHGITVSGVTKYENTQYDTYYEIPISTSVISDIESIKYKTENGLTYIYVYIKKPKTAEIKIEKI